MGVSESDDEPMPDEPVDDEPDDIEDEGSVEDSEEEEEDVANYEDDGFVVDAEEESEDGQSSPGLRESKPKKIRKKKTDDQLVEEDLSWLAENASGMHRGRHPRRLKKAVDLAGPSSLLPNRSHQTFDEGLDDDLEDDDEDAMDRQMSRNETGDLFDHDEMEMDDFIVDEASDQRRQHSRRRPRDQAMTAAYQEALQEVAEIFGEAEELIAMYETARRESRAATHMQPEADGSRFPGQLRPMRLEDYDPEALAMHCLLPEDDDIRCKNVPERFQLRMGEAPNEFEYEMAAEWMYKKIFDGEFRTPDIEILENGQLEIDGVSADDDYCGKSPDIPCNGHRAMRPLRTNTQKELWRSDVEAQSTVKASIVKVLKHIYEDLEEIPFIATYRTSSCGELLCMASDEVPKWTTLEEYNEHKDEGVGFPPPGAIQARSMKMKRWQLLWTVYEWSLRWRRLRSRIEKRMAIYMEGQLLCPDIPSAVYSIQKCIDQLAEVTSAEEGDLADRRFRLIMAALRHKVPHSDLPQDSKIQRYCTYNDNGYHTIVEGMGLRKFLELDLGHRATTGKFESPLCSSVDLQDVVADIMQKNKGVVGLDAVLIGARHMAAMDLSTHPYVRETAKKLYEAHATITTTPTDSGEKVLDPFHVYGFVKRLVDKPMKSFKGDTFVRILGAVKKGYLQYTLSVKDTVFRVNCHYMNLDELAVQDHVLPSLMTSVLRSGLGSLHEGWGDFQGEVVDQLAKEHLFPLLKKEAIQNLSERSRACVLNKISENLWNFVTQGPFKPAIDENSYEDEDAMVRVCACCWGQGGKGQPSTVLIMLDAHGELRDMMELKQFSGFFDPPFGHDAMEASDVLSDELKKEDAQRIREFLMEHKPHVVVVGGAHMACKQLVADLELIRDHFLTEHSRFMVSIQGNMEVLLTSESVPAIWENSPAAKAELPDHSAHIRRAVALGRCLIDPLSVMAALRDHANTILSVNLGDLQECVVKEERLVRIDQVMVTALNQMGAELNLMANVQWRTHALQFVAGLGRRKAMGLLHLLHRNAKRMESRALLMTHDHLGTHVLKNCISFLIVNDSALPGMANLEFDVLDETRIHIDKYGLAKEMAMLAAGNQDPDAALVELGEKPELIRNLDVEWFNRRCMDRGRGDVTMDAIDIAMELFAPFHDRRPAFVKPNELDVFYLLLNEKAESMKPGKLVEAVVQQVDENEIHCTLVQSRLKGTIKKDQFSSSEDPQQIDLKSRVHRGDILTARLVGIEYKDFFVELSCRSMDLENDERWEREYCTDLYYSVKTEAEKEQERLTKEIRREKPFITRRIDHPLFKNITLDECNALLSRMPPGYAVLRPSRDGYQYVTLSFNASSSKYGDVLMHRNMKEEERTERRGPSTKLNFPLTLMLTSKLQMKFDDLDEVVPCFVDPYIDRLKALRMHRKFLDGDFREVDQLVKEEKQRLPRSAGAYALAVDYNQQGCYYIASVLNETLRREYFMIVPEGYYYRKQVFKDIESMIDEFKRQPQPPVMQQRVSMGMASRGRSRGNWPSESRGGRQPSPARPPQPDTDSSDELRF